MTRFQASFQTIRRWLKASTALTTAVAMGLGQPTLALAQNLPTGGTVAAGSATISQPNANSQVINQTSQTAITNWQSFSIGQGNSVTVVQPSTSAAMLARVTGTTTSTIAGSLSATGQLMLVNPNGISITPTGTVKAGSGFIATTLQTSDDDFLAGRARLTGNGASNAVANAGTITVGPGGYAALIGGTVANSGTISVPMGRVGLGSGEVATLDFSGDGFLQVGVPTKADGTGALVSNSGKIVASGGRVEIKAAAARDAARQAINMSGVVAARSVSGSDGNITLDGGDGQVAVSGKLNASSRTGKGGHVTVTGRDIKLANARVNASGKTGGGTVRIGGDRQGQGTLAHAETTTIDTASVVKADATQTGNGGTITVWSDTRTDFAGTISAKGGLNGGNGGEAEVSSHGLLAYTGTTVLTAPMGKTGTLLLDPYNVTISNGTDTGGFTASANDSVINVGTLQTALQTANVTVSTGSSGSQAGDITIASPLTWSANLLRLDAAHSIKVAATVTVGGTGALMLNTNVGGGSGGVIDFGLTSTGFTGRIDFTGTPGTQALFFNMAQQTLVYSLANLQNINNGFSGNYALAKNLDASGTTYTNSLIANFAGTFDGLGHTISNLTITSAIASDPLNAPPTGLFGHVFAGSISNIGLVGGSVSNPNTNFIGGTDGANVGALAGLVQTDTLPATIRNAFATTNVSGGDQFNAGGLVGQVTSTNGGAVTISNTFATGNVSIGNNGVVGGLVGNSNANGPIQIAGSYATGTVTGGFHSDVGGLVGYNGPDSRAVISDSYATGMVSAGDTSYVGGLVGYNPGNILNAYATGAVTTNSGTPAGIGGLVGLNGGTISASFYDMTTTGQSDTGKGTGLTTAQLQNGTSAAGLGSAFRLSAGLYPYLNSFFPNGAQAISGIAYADSGVTRYASDAHGARTVYVDVAGQQTAVTTGANGYYYVALANGTLSSANGGTAVVAYTRDGTITGPVTGANLFAATGTTQNADIWAHTLIVSTSATSMSVAGSSGSALLGANGDANRTLLTAAAGGDTVPTSDSTGIAALPSAGYIATSSAGFTIDQGISAYGLYARTTTGPITISSAQTLGGPINVMLNAASDININAPVTLSTGRLTLASGGVVRFAAPVTVKGAGTVDIEASDYDFGLTNSGFTGSLTYVKADGTAATSDQGGVLKINRQTYQLLYSLAQFDALDNQNAATVDGTAAPVSGNYAFAGDFDGSGTTYHSALVGADGGNLISFDGTLTGLGHKIANLTISSCQYCGLVGLLTGTVRDIGINGGTVSGGYAGGLVGYLTTGAQAGYSGPGIVRNAYSSAAVNGSGYVGGLVGYSSGGTISNVWATGQATSLSDYAGGLVGYSDSSSISKAHATGSVSAAHWYAGGLVGQSTHDTITDVYATGAVSGITEVGGLVGSNAIGSSITNAWATGNVTATGDGVDVGGLVGSSDQGAIINAWASGAVSGQTYVGGLVGKNTSNSITNAYAAGAISGVGFIGGLVGYSDQSSISNAHATGNVTGSNYLGGLVGRLDQGTITNAYASGDVSGLGQYVGGLVGYNNNGSIPNAYATGAVSGTLDVGGLAGYSDVGRFQNAYATGSVTGGNNAGGLIGASLEDDIANTYATGAVSGQSNVGGLIGTRTGSVYGVTNSYWNVETTGRTRGIGYIGDLTLSSNRGLTTAEMRDPFTFINAGWDFATVWGTSTTGTNGGKPMLRTFSTGLYDDYATVTSANLTKTYGNANPSLSGATINVGVGTGTVGIDWGSAINAATSVGTYSFASPNVLSATDTNGRTAYISATGQLSVTPRALMVTADAQSRIYGNANPALTYTVGGLGFVNGDTLSGSLATAATGTSGVGSYAITQGTLANSNYAITYTGANLAVTTRALTVTANAQSRIYGNANPALTYTLGGLGLVNGDTLSGSLATAATGTSGVGSYAITQGTLAATANYALSYAGASLAVTQRAITVAADPQSRIYGNANPALTYTLGGLGLVNGDTLSGNLATTATSTSGVGSYAITQGTLAATANYALSYAGASLAVTQRAITVAADPQSRIYGNANPALTYTVGGLGLLNGDMLSGGLATAATGTSGVGSYAITQGSLATSSNYALTYTGAFLTIAPVATNPSTGGTPTSGGTTTPDGTGTTGGSGTTGDNPNPGGSPDTGTPTIAVKLPPSIFATTVGGTPFTPPGQNVPVSNPSAPGVFTSRGYDTPAPCVAGRACGS